MEKPFDAPNTIRITEGPDIVHGNWFRIRNVYTTRACTVEREMEEKLFASQVFRYSDDLNFFSILGCRISAGFFVCF